jgi:hypothetical protein
MIYAMWCLTNGCSSNRERRKLSRLYETNRKIFREQRTKDMTGPNNHFFGKKHSEETKDKLRGENNPAKRPEVREKMRGERPGQIRGPHSESRKANIALALKGAPLSEERRLNMSRAKQDLIWVYKPGEKPQQVKNGPIPNGWSRGRGPRQYW